MAAVTLVRRAHDSRTQLNNRLFRRRGLPIPQWSFVRRPVSRTVPVPEVGRDLQVKIASTRPEWEQAFRLVEENYEAHGYEAPHAGEYRFTPYHALPCTFVVVAKEQGRVLATLSVIMDNTLLGLPAEGIYPAEIEDVRRRGRRLFEFGNLADRGLSRREFLPVFLTLVQVAVQAVHRQGADMALVTSTVRHGIFYRKVMGFMPLGPSRPYPYVRDTLAQAYWLDIPHLKATLPALHQRLLGEALSAEVLVPASVPADLVRQLATRSSKCPAGCTDTILRSVASSGCPRRW